jgi:hypothetical protein
LQWPRQIQVVEDNETAPKNSIDASDEEIMQAAEVLRKEGLFKCKLADNASSYLAWRRQQRQRLNAAPGTSI